MPRLLLISHCADAATPSALDVMGLGDGIRLLVAVQALQDAGWRVTVAGGASLAELWRQPALAPLVADVPLIAVDALPTVEDRPWDKVLFCDHPMRADTVLPREWARRIELLWPEGRGGYKGLSQRLVSRLLLVCGAPPFSPSRLSVRSRRNGRDGAISVGLHPRVPPAWRNKSPDDAFWEETARELMAALPLASVSWQPGAPDLTRYLSWIASLDFLVTPIALGLHVALLFGVQVVLLQGPTWCEEVAWIPRERVFVPGCGRSPCFLSRCPLGERGCFAELSARWVVERVAA